jgi:uncharacterized membrane protein YcfT
MLHQRLMWIVWPAFLMAGVLEVLVFAMVDPQDVRWFGTPLDWSRQAIYTAAFFVFWVVTALSGSLTTLLASSPYEVNHCPLPATDRPDEGPKQGTS